MQHQSLAYVVLDYCSKDVTMEGKACQAMSQLPIGLYLWAVSDVLKSEICFSHKVVWLSLRVWSLRTEVRVPSHQKVPDEVVWAADQGMTPCRISSHVQFVGALR